MKKNNVYVAIALLTASKLMAQDPNQVRWSQYISSLTNISSFYEGYKRTQLVNQNNELEYSSGCTPSNIYENPLVLNGKTLDYGTFNLSSEGELTLVKGQPQTPEAKAIPFYVYIRRDGKILESPKMTFKDKKLYKIQLSDIFPHCQDGDLLIIKPVNAEDWRAKRILKLLGGC